LVDEHLWWDKQIDNISKKTSKGIGMLRRVKPYVPTKTLQHLYQALVQPRFDYCSMVWGNCGEYLRGNFRSFKTELLELLPATHMKYARLKRFKYLNQLKDLTLSANMSRYTG
jgi:DNA repair photolyase